ncbi:hypothetical protein BDZ94DRAFT_1239945 [Collybia nuda]|uniref:Uncharacterized protein n=1 Tax=Collybia nuda TaxID=64659 RepID=A0A9P5XXR6_9AGAR|nr:hypothetical protein BDZ94DRAFT_1239945 [Collybia nuda]
MVAKAITSTSDSPVFTTPSSLEPPPTLPFASTFSSPTLYVLQKSNSNNSPPIYVSHVIKPSVTRTQPDSSPITQIPNDPVVASLSHDPNRPMFSTIKPPTPSRTPKMTPSTFTSNPNTRENTLSGTGINTNTNFSPTPTLTSVAIPIATPMREPSHLKLSQNKDMIGTIIGITLAIFIPMVVLVAFIIQRRRTRQLKHGRNDENSGCHPTEGSIGNEEDAHQDMHVHSPSNDADLETQSNFSETSSHETLGQPVMSIVESEYYPPSTYHISTLPLYPETIRSVSPPGYSECSRHRSRSISEAQSEAQK